MNRFLTRAGLGLLIIVLAAPVSTANERYPLWVDFGGGSASLPSGWAVGDANLDGYQWSPWNFGGARGGCCLRYLSNPGQAADDWVFTEALSLTPVESYTLHFAARVTSTGLPHKLEAWVGQAQNPGGMTTQIYSDEALAFDSTQDLSVPFTVGGGGTWYIGFRCHSDPGMLALFLDRVGLALAEQDLVVTLQPDRGIYQGSATYTPGDPVQAMVLVTNTGMSPITVNSLLTVGHEPDPNAVLSFLVTGPSGDVPFLMKVKPAKPAPGDFVALGTGDTVHKYYDLGLGFDFSAPGDYFIEAVYRNPYPDAGGTAWIGRLVSTPVMITVEE